MSKDNLNVGDYSENPSIYYVMRLFFRIKREIFVLVDFSTIQVSITREFWILELIHHVMYVLMASQINIFMLINLFIVWCSPNSCVM